MLEAFQGGAENTGGDRKVRKEDRPAKKGMMSSQQPLRVTRAQFFRDTLGLLRSVLPKERKHSVYKHQLLWVLWSRYLAPQGVDSRHVQHSKWDGSSNTEARRSGEHTQVPRGVAARIECSQTHSTTAFLLKEQYILSEIHGFGNPVCHTVC